MTYLECLTQIIDRGISSAKQDYNTPEQKNKLDGSIAGFEACRDKTPDELKEVWSEVGFYTGTFSHYNEVETYWWYRCYQLEVEWVMNCVSVILLNEGKEPLLLWLPTCNAAMAVSKILNPQSKPPQP